MCSYKSMFPVLLLLLTMLIDFFFLVSLSHIYSCFSDFLFCKVGFLVVFL